MSRGRLDFSVGTIADPTKAFQVALSDIGKRFDDYQDRELKEKEAAQRQANWEKDHQIKLDEFAESTRRFGIESAYRDEQAKKAQDNADRNYLLSKQSHDIQNAAAKRQADEYEHNLGQRRLQKDLAGISPEAEWLGQNQGNLAAINDVVSREYNKLTKEEKNANEGAKVQELIKRAEVLYKPSLTAEEAYDLTKARAMQSGMDADEASKLAEQKAKPYRTQNELDAMATAADKQRLESVKTMFDATIAKAKAEKGYDSEGRVVVNTGNTKSNGGSLTVDDSSKFLKALNITSNDAVSSTGPALEVLNSSRYSDLPNSTKEAILSSALATTYSPGRVWDTTDPDKLVAKVNELAGNALQVRSEKPGTSAESLDRGILNSAYNTLVTTLGNTGSRYANIDQLRQKEFADRVKGFSGSGSLPEPGNSRSEMVSQAPTQNTETAGQASVVTNASNKAPVSEVDKLQSYIKSTNVDARLGIISPEEAKSRVAYATNNTVNTMLKDPKKLQEALTSKPDSENLVAQLVAKGRSLANAKMDVAKANMTGDTSTVDKILNAPELSWNDRGESGLNPREAAIAYWTNGRKPAADYYRDAAKNISTVFNKMSNYYSTDYPRLRFARASPEDAAMFKRQWEEQQQKDKALQDLRERMLNQ